MGNANGRQPPHAHHPNQAYTLSALVQGELAGPSGAVSGEWAARFYNAQGELLGTTPVWAAAEYQQPDTPALQTGTVSHASAAQMRLATTVTLDEGWLNFSDLTQQTASAPLPVVGGETYSLTVRLSGQLSTAEMGRLLLVTDGTPALVWSNTDVQQMDGIVISHAFTPPPNANTVHLVVETPLAGGWLALADVALAQFVPVQTITRSTYMLAGQATATRVSGHPDGNDGLHTLYSDHLGSASAMQKDDGSAPIITRYLPFGGYRASSGPNEVTDRGFTGHKHNDDLGLVYMNARFYVSYHDYGCLVEAHSLANAYGVSFDILAKYWVFGASTPEALGAIWAAFMSSIPQLANPNPMSGDALAVPETVAELMTMMGIAQDIADIAQRLFDTSGAFRADCHHVCAAYTGQTFDEFDETAAWWANIYYELGEISGAITLSRRTEVVYAFERDEDNILPSSSWAVTYGGKHSALMVSFDANDPANSIVVQVNGSVNASGVYFTRIRGTVFFQEHPYIGIPE